MSFTRRRFINSVASLIALPALESFNIGRFASAKNNVIPPKRLLFMGIGYGVTAESWFPSSKRTTSDYEITPGLNPLLRHKNDFSIVQGCTHHNSRDAHWGSTFWLTGADRYSIPGKDFANSISVDQVAARAWGANTRYPSIQLANSPKDKNGHGPGHSLAWDSNGKPLTAWNSPLEFYTNLFASKSVSKDVLKTKIAEKQSMLDVIAADANGLMNRVSKSDAVKLDEYFESIRSIELALSRDLQWVDIPKPEAPFDAPSDQIYGKSEVEMMYKLMAIALKTDSTRVMTYRQPGTQLLRSINVRANAHNISHYVNDSVKIDASKKRDLVQSELLAGFIDDLKSHKELDGTSLFDNLALAFGSNIRSIHYLDNPPTLISGGGANLKLGHNIVLENGTPLNNVWLTLLHGLGLHVDRHGDSTGIVQDMLS